MRCQVCGRWSRVTVNKVFVEQNSPKPQVKVFIPMYEPLQVSKCEKCGKIIAQPKELIRIVKSKMRCGVEKESREDRARLIST
jgi:hypothetical protein